MGKVQFLSLVRESLFVPGSLGAEALRIAEGIKGELLPLAQELLECLEDEIKFSGTPSERTLETVEKAKRILKGEN